MTSSRRLSTACNEWLPERIIFSRPEPWSSLASPYVADRQEGGSAVEGWPKPSALPSGLFSAIRWPAAPSAVPR